MSAHKTVFTGVEQLFEVSHTHGFLNGSKGQSAIEYLTTYGWMLLVVTIVGSSVYAMVNSGCNLEVSSGRGTGLTVADSGVTGGNTFSVLFRNSESSIIEIESVELGGRSSDENQGISVGEEGNYDVAEVESTGSCQEYTMSVVYDSGTLNGLEKTFTVTAPFELAEIIVEKLLAGGDAIEEIKTRETVLPTNNSTMCFGEDCGTTDSGNLSGTEKYINISGDSMQGTLETDSMEANCYGDLCNTTKTGDLGYVSSQNNTMNGTLNLTEAKPISNMCLGGTCT